MTGLRFGAAAWVAAHRSGTGRAFVPTLVVCAACVALLPVAIMKAAGIGLDIGGATIQIPLPDGFVRVDGVLPRWDAATEAFISPQNRRALVLGTPGDLEALRAGRPPDFPRSFNVQVARSVERQDFGERTFQDAKAGIKAGIDQVQQQLQAFATAVAAQGNTRLAPGNIDDALRLADTVFVGYFRDTPTSLGVTMAMKVTGGGTAAPERVVVAFVMTPVNGRLLNLYANARYASEADRAWVETAVAAWADATVAANPRVTGPRGAPFDWTSVVPQVAIAIGVLVLVVGVRRLVGRSAARRG